MQGELAHNEQIAGDVADAEVHFVIRVGKNPHARDFARQPFDVGCRVGRFDSEQNQQSATDGGDGVAVHADTCLGDSLNDRSHSVSMCNGWAAGKD